MKNILVLCLAFFAACSFAQAAAQKAQPKIANPFYADFYKLGGSKKVTLNSGSILLLETAEKIYSDQVTVGKVFRFRVVADVMAEGEIAIRTGAFAMGRVKAISTTSYNDPESIRIELMFVQAVDGQSVPLMGDELTITGQQSGQGTPVEFATSITSHVTNSMTIKID